jgi:hypothetical protein
MNVFLFQLFNDAFSDETIINGVDDRIDNEHGTVVDWGAAQVIMEFKENPV